MKTNYLELHLKPHLFAEDRDFHQAGASTSVTNDTHTRISNELSQNKSRQKGDVGGPGDSQKGLHSI